MRRKRLNISVTLAVLTLGLVVGWVAGERPTSVDVDSTMAHQEGPQVERVSVPLTLRQRYSALRMPYFSFKNILPRPQGEPGA